MHRTAAEDEAEVDTWLCAHGPAEGGGVGVAAGWLVGRSVSGWLSNGATSSSESNCNYVYIVADMADDVCRRGIVD